MIVNLLNYIYYYYKCVIIDNKLIIYAGVIEKGFLINDHNHPLTFKAACQMYSQR